MSKLIKRLAKEKAITPPKWLPDNIMYLCQMGSVAYGVSTEASDKDIYGFVIPPKDMVWKPLNRHIPGFDKLDAFEQWQQHHIKAHDGNDYDFSVYNITKYFNLVMQCNPNMIDSLFVPRNCVIHSTPISELIREHRRLFLHKGAWHKFKGYAYSQVHKMKIKTPQPDSKREELYQKYGYDTKFAYHVVRLLNEVEQILGEGTLDLQRNREQLKAIRRGEWSETDVYDYFGDKESDLEKLYQKSDLPYGPDVAAIRKLLFECLEMHYDLSDTIVEDVSSANKLAQIQKILND